MTPDPVIRVLLGLILACLVVLVIQGFGDDRAPSVAALEVGSEGVTSPPIETASTNPETAAVAKAEAKREKKKKKKPVQLKPPPPPPLPAPRPIKVNPQTEIEALSHALTPENPQSIRIWAAEQLGTQPGGQAVAVLTATLGDADPRVVVAAIRSLRDSEDPRAREAIEPMLKHENQSVKDAARQALSAQ